MSVHVLNLELLINNLIKNHNLIHKTKSKARTRNLQQTNTGIISSKISLKHNFDRLQPILLDTQNIVLILIAYTRGE